MFPHSECSPDFRISVSRVAALLLLSLPAAATTYPPVPSAYQDLFTSLNSQIASFSNTVNAGWNQVPYPVTYAAHLNSANSALGPQLLGSSVFGAVLTELQELQALGVRAVVVTIDFPVLCPDFYSTSAEYQQYLNFYIQVAGAVRSRGLKLIIETNAVVPLPGVTNFNPSSYYNSLTWEQYENGRAQTAVIIAQNLQPDYLSILGEPDTEATQTGKSEVNTADGATDLVNVILAALAQQPVPGVVVGGGVGSWQASFQSFIQGLTGTALQFIDIHIYDPNNDNLSNALTIADMAHSAGKSMAMTECWIDKIRPTEEDVLSYTTISGRDPFSFWMPVDISFLQAMVNYSQYEQLRFMAPFWTQYFFANLDYNTVSALSSQQIMAQAVAAAGQAMSQGQFTSTGLAWEQMIAPADTTAPTTPGNFVAQPGYGSITLSWSPSTDNIGVAGYRILRDGALLTLTSAVSYADRGLAADTAHTYSITAFDARGNYSPAASASATTLFTSDTIPPTAPTHLVATGVSAAQINLSWSPSTDNVGVSGYAVYRGTSPTGLTLYASSASNSYSDTNASLAITYYYTVAAFDPSNNYSPQSAMASAAPLTGLTCDLNGDGHTDVVDVQLSISADLGIVPCGAADVTGDGICNVVDVARIINAALGLGCVVGP